MLRMSINTILPTITTLGIYDRLAGLVRPVSRVINKGNDENPNFQKQIFPVDCGVTSTDCWEAGKKYLDLVPNTDRKGIGYFEEVTPMRMGNAIGGDIIEFTASVRFVNIVNFKKLNINSTGATVCSIAPNIVLSLINSLDEKSFPVTHGSVSSAIVDFYFDHQEEPANVFDKYSYRDSMAENKSSLSGFRNIDSVFLYPTEVISTMWTVTLKVAKGCISTLVQGTEITC